MLELATKPWGHENLGEILASDMHTLGLQFVGGGQEHIFFSGKQATKEIDRGSKQLTGNHTPDASLLVIKKGMGSPLTPPVSSVLASTK